MSIATDGRGPVKAAIYARVSGEEQAEKETIKNQLIACREFCLRQGWEIAAEYCDEVIKGPTAFANRPAGGRLLEDGRAGKFNAVVLLRLDRLSRDVAEGIVAYRHLRSLRLEVKSLSESFDDTPTGRFIFNIFMSVAELELGLIAERTKAGRRRKAAQGKFVGGFTPLGYVLNPETRHFVIYEPHAAIVREMFRLYIELGSPWAVAKRLPPVPPFDSELAPGMQWFPSAFWRNGTDRPQPVTAKLVNNVIPNIVYLGIYQREGPPVEDAHDPIVDRAIWEAAQAIYRQRHKARGRTVTSKPLLSGLLRCGAHNINVQADARGYTCNRMFRLRVEPFACFWVYGPALETAICDHVLARLDFSGMVSEVIHALEVESRRYQESIESSRRQRARLQREIDSLIGNLAYVSGPQTVAAIEKEIEERRRFIRQLENEPGPPSGATPDQVEIIKAFLEDLRPYWAGLSNRGRNGLLRQLIEEITLIPDGREIWCEVRWRGGPIDRLVVTRSAAGRKHWQPHEDEWLKANYATATWPEIHAALPDRTPIAINRRAWLLGQRRPMQWSMQLRKSDNNPSSRRTTPAHRALTPAPGAPECPR